MYCQLFACVIFKKFIRKTVGNLKRGRRAIIKRSIILVLSALDLACTRVYMNAQEQKKKKNYCIASYNDDITMNENI